MHIVMVECNPNGVAGIANALQLGHQVTLVSADPDFYLNASPLAADAFAHPRCRIVKSTASFSIDVLEKIVRDVHAESPVHGVTTYSEYHTVHAATVAGALGLPGMSVQGALNARHKHRTRLALEHTDVPQPRFAHVRDATQIEAAIRKIGFPCVVKPSDGSASLHVLSLACEQDLEKYLAELAKVADYGHRTLSGFPYFIEMGATYFRGHPSEDELFGLTQKVLRHLGIDFGFIHTEYLLGEDGPVLCEVNGRLIGGVAPNLMKISSGVDPYLEVIRQALCETPVLPFPGEVTASARWFGSPAAGTLKSLDFAKVSTLPGFVEALCYKRPGNAVARLSKSNFDWLGHVIFTGQDRDEAAKRCEAALDDVGLEIAVEVAR